MKTSARLRSGLLFVPLAVLALPWLTSCAEGGASGGAKSAGGEGHPMIGLHAPSFSRPSVSGGGTLSVDASKGKVVIVDFWATYCKPCEKSFPKLQAIAEAHAGQVVVYGLSEDEAPGGIAAFAKKTGAKFPIGWDEGNSISERYKLDKMPTSYIVDKKGIIRYVHGGYEDGTDAAIARQVDELAR